MINKFTSVAIILDDYELQEFNNIQLLLDNMKKELLHSELILILENQFLKDQIINKLESIHKHEIPIKIVTTSKPTKEYVFTNLSWKCAMGDYIIFNQRINSLLKVSFYDIVEQLESNPLAWLVDKEFYTTYYKQLNIGYNLFKNKKDKNQIIHPATSGFAITRQGCNKVFENYNEIYDTFSTLAISGLTSSIIYLNLEKKYMYSSNYHISNILELLLIYTKNYGFLLYFMFALLVFFILGPILNAPFLGIITSLFIGLYMIYTLQKYTLDAAQHKQLAGQYEIFVLK